MALRDALSRFLRDKASAKRNAPESGSETQDGSSTALDNLASDVDSGDDPELVLLVERLEGFYDPDRDEFVPTSAAVEVIEAFGTDGNDDSRQMLRDLGDTAPAAGEADRAQS
jgi:hypothetical protein